MLWYTSVTCVLLPANLFRIGICFIVQKVCVTCVYGLKIRIIYFIVVCRIYVNNFRCKCGYQ